MPGPCLHVRLTKIKFKGTNETQDLVLKILNLNRKTDESLWLTCVLQIIIRKVEIQYIWRNSKNAEEKDEHIRERWVKVTVKIYGQNFKCLLAGEVVWFPAWDTCK